MEMFPGSKCYPNIDFWVMLLKFVEFPKQNDYNISMYCSNKNFKARFVNTGI